MKTKIMILFILSSLAFTCNGDEDQDKVILTADNYFYEGDLHILSLTNRIDAFNSRIEELDQVSPNDPNYNQAQMEKEESIVQRDLLIVERQGISPRNSTLPELPPCPDDDVYRGILCIPKDGQTIYNCDEEINRAKIVFLNEAGERVGGSISSELSGLPDFEELKHSPYTINPNTEGTITAKVERTNSQNETTTYEAKVRFIN